MEGVYKTYSQKLKDPRWQKRRLEILNRDGFKCCYCGDAKTELHVHHRRYSGDPWNSEDCDLETLCKDCHDIVELIKGGYNGLEIIIVHKFGVKEKLLTSISFGLDVSFEKKMLLCEHSGDVVRPILLCLVDEFKAIFDDFSNR